MNSRSPSVSGYNNSRRPSGIVEVAPSPIRHRALSYDSDHEGNKKKSNAQSGRNSPAALSGHGGAAVNTNMNIKHTLRLLRY